MFVPQSCTTFVWLLNRCILERMISLVLIFGVIGLSYLKLLMEGGQELVTSPKPFIESDHLAETKTIIITPLVSNAHLGFDCEPAVVANLIAAPDMSQFVSERSLLEPCGMDAAVLRGTHRVHPTLSR